MKSDFPTATLGSSQAPTAAVEKSQPPRTQNFRHSQLKTWADRRGIKIEYIQPGKPQQNAYVERFNRTVRYEWLAQYHFDSIDEAQDFATRWMWSYNHERPNMALGGFTPKQRLAMAA
jgi:putative transposase